MIMDFHTHAFPDAVAEKAIPKLAGIGKLEPLGNGTVSGLIEKMDKWHIDRAVVLNIATNPRQQTNVNNFAIEINGFMGRLYSLGSLNPDSDNIMEEARRLRDSGIRGIKIHPDYMGAVIDDDRFDPVYRACTENDLFVISPSGWDFISPDLIHCTPEGICRVLDKYPTLRFIAAHLGACKQWDEVERRLVGRDNLWLETSLAPAFGLDKQIFARILRSHAPDRLLFGSDFPWCSPASSRDYIDSLDISDELKKAIFSENALKLMGELKA